jgi:hypothetical protein
MKKLKQRKGIVALMAVAVVLLCLGGNSVWRGITHHGPGVVEFGSFGSEAHGNMGTDLSWEVVPEHKYKRVCYQTGGVLIFVAVAIFGGVIWALNRRDSKTENVL